MLPSLSTFLNDHYPTTHFTLQHRILVTQALSFPFLFFVLFCFVLFFCKIIRSSLFQLDKALKKIVVNAREKLRILGAVHDLSLSLLMENLVLTIGKAMKTSSQKANFANQETAFQEKVFDILSITYCFFFFNLSVISHPHQALAG